MDCNCININNGGAVFRHVYGNVLRMAIPLTVRTVELVDGDATTTDADFIPSQDYPVEVVLQRENRRAITIEATMRDGNIAYIEDLGTVPVGQYAITVMCKDDNGNPYRFKQNDVLNVVDTTAEAGIEKGIEYDVTVWYLDSAIYLVLKGEDGVGIEDIVTETSGEIGGTNTVTIILSDGRQKSFTVLNGSGAVDGDFNPNSNHPVSNSVITERFNAVDTAIAGLFGDVDYDSQTKSIRFYNKNKSAILATLDAKPFIKDGMVNSVYISNNTLVITFNTDAGREAIGVPLTSVFNPNNYYTKVQVDSRIATALDNLNLSNYYTKSQTDRLVGKKADVSNDGKVPASETTPVVLDYIYAPAPGPVIPINPHAGEVIYFANEKKIRRYYYEYAGQSGGLPAIVYVEETPSKYVVYHNKGNEKFYRYDAGSLSMVEIETGTGVKIGSTTYEPTDGVVDISAGIPDVDTAIAGLADVARTGDYDDLENKPTIPDVSNLATKSELQSKADASNVYTKSEVDNALALKQGNITDLEQIRAGATLGASSYQKPHSGIPASDLADGVIPDVSGFVTASDVADAVADLVDSAPDTLDTLNELAAALGDDPNFATTMATALGNKVDKVSGKGLSSEDYTTAEKTKLANLATVANTGSYNDLTDKPTIPAAITVDSTITQNGTNPVQGGAIYSALEWKEDRQRVIVDIQCEINYPIGYSVGGNTITGAELYALCADPKKDVVLRIIGYDANEDDDVDYSDDILYHCINDSLSEYDIQYYASWWSGMFLLVGLSIESEGASIYFDAGIEEFGYVPTNRKINNKALSSDITLTASDVGALPASTTIPTKTSDLTNDSGFIDKVLYYGTCATAASTMPKVCTVESFPTTTSGNVTHAKDGTIIAVKFTNSDTNTTAAPTLNVNGIGEKAIMYNNAIITSTAKNTTVAGYAKQIAYYRYDPELDEGNGAWEYLGKSVDSNSTYSPVSLGFGYASQSNASASATITATLSSYSLTTNGIVSVKFTYDVPASATLNINSKGAKAIYNQGTAITAGVIKAGDTATFIYSTYYHLISVDSWQEKQDTISDLSTIRTGAAAGATALQPADVSVDAPATPDGTFELNVGGDSYTVNLNHTHEGMAKLAKCTEATLPQTLADDTIYVQVDDATNPTEIEKLYLFGLEFAGGVADTTPKLTSPASGVTIDFDGAATETLVIKGRNLTAALSLVVTGDFTVTANGSTVSSISASDANDGVTLTLTKGSGFSGGSLAISSTEIDTRSVSVVDTYVPEVPEGFLADSAWDGSNGSGEVFSAPGTVAGFCTCPFYEIGKGSDNKIHISVKAGFIRAQGEKRFIVFRPYTYGNTNAAYGQSADPRELNFNSAENHIYRYVSATFKSSEIDNCYIYDFVAGRYLFAGKNVDTSVAPTATL